jgi:hypothetical protein
MVKFTVDTTNKLFVAKVGIIAVDVQIDLYSDAKEHWLSDTVALGFDFPIRTVGGDPLDPVRDLGVTYFLTGGWKIRPDEADHRLVVTGNLFVDGGVGNPFVVTLGDFNVVIELQTSNIMERLATIEEIRARCALIPALV